MNAQKDRTLKAYHDVSLWWTLAERRLARKIRQARIDADKQAVLETQVGVHSIRRPVSTTIPCGTAEEFAHWSGRLNDAWEEFERIMSETPDDITREHFGQVTRFLSVLYLLWEALATTAEMVEASNAIKQRLWDTPQYKSYKKIHTRFRQRTKAFKEYKRAYNAANKGRRQAEAYKELQRASGLVRHWRGRVAAGGGAEAQERLTEAQERHAALKAGRNQQRRAA